MNRRKTLILAAAFGLAVAAGGTAQAFFVQGGDAAAAELRASGVVGEQHDGYMGLAGSGSAEIRAKVDAINIQRRAYYTDLAARRGATIEEVAASTACQLLRTKVGPGQYYRLPDGVWRRRNGNEPVPIPAYCG